MSLSSLRRSGGASSSNGKSAFYPRAVDSFEEAGLNPAMIESLVLKFLLKIGMAAGRRIAAELGLAVWPFSRLSSPAQEPADPRLRQFGVANDYVYSLTDTGRARAKMYLEECAYVGPAPVPFEDYLASVAAQTITTEHPKEADLGQAFSDLLIAEETFRLLGPGHQLGPRPLPLRLSRQRQDQHRRAHHPLFWHDRLDPQGHPGRRPDHQAVRHGEPRTGRDRAIRRFARRVRPRPPLDPDQAPDDRCRRRTADGRPRDPLRST